MGDWSRLRLAALLLLLSLPAAAADCKVEGLAKVTLPEWADCAAFRFNFAMARHVALERGWATETELASAWAPARVRVLEEAQLPCGTVPLADGCTAPDGSILLAQDGGALLHELLHVLEKSRGHRGHAQWEERGWLRVVNEVYPRRRIDLSAFLLAAPRGAASR
jgi:hypothetical protein